MIIDFHTHIFPDKIAEKTITMLAEKANLQPSINGTVQQLLSSMDKAGIDKSVVLPIVTKPEQTETINRFAKELNQTDRIYSFGSFHPEDENWKGAMKSIADLGLYGIKLHPEYQDFYVDTPKLYPMYEYAAQLGLPILFHAGVDLGIPGEIHCTPKRMKQVICDCPDTTFIAAHGGGFQCWDEVELELVGEHIYFDISMTYGWAKKGQLERIIKNHGADKILFASDCPWDEQAEAVQAFKELQLTEEEQKQVCYKTALGLLQKGRRIV